MEIYIDVVFLINFIMNTLVIYITKRLLRESVRLLKIVFFGFLSSLLYIIIAFVPVLHAINNGFTQLLIILFCIYFLFIPKSILIYIRQLVCFHLISFVLGGIGLYLLYFFNYENILGSGISFNFKAPIVIFFVLSGVSYFLIVILHRFLKEYLLNKQSFAMVSIGLNGNIAEIRALIDTGNTLYCPITNTPVMIAEFHSIKNILPPKLKLVFYENKDGDISNFVDFTEDMNIRAIPYKSIGKEKGILLGFVPDDIKIRINDKDINIGKGGVIVGICNFKLSKFDYEGLLNPDLIKYN